MYMCVYVSSSRCVCVCVRAREYARTHARTHTHTACVYFFVFNNPIAGERLEMLCSIIVDSIVLDASGRCYLPSMCVYPYSNLHSIIPFSIS